MPTHPPLSTLADVAVASSGTCHCYPEWHNFPVQCINKSPQYPGTVKCHNVFKRHIAIDTGFKQTESTIFLHLISMELKL